MQQRKIVLAEIDFTYKRLIRQYLEKKNFQVISTVSGFEVCKTIKDQQPDLLILSEELAGISGQEVLRIMGKENSLIPIIYLQGNGKSRCIASPKEAIVTLNRPVDLTELDARMKELLPDTSSLDSKTNDLFIDTKKKQAFLGNQDINLSDEEFNLLLFLAKNSGRVFSKQTIFNLAWGCSYTNDCEIVNLCIGSLSQKIKAYLQHYGDSRENGGSI